MPPCPRLLLAAAMCAVALGCAPTTDDAAPLPRPPPDAGARADAGAPADGGSAPDTGAPPDVGAAPDGGAAPDAGSRTDAGAPGDADARAQADAGAPGDTAAPADARPPADAGRGADATDARTLPPVTVYIAGDSTVMTYPANAANMQAGWGQMLPEYFTAQARFSNQAIGGRTSRRFIEEGRLTTILNAIKPGDTLLVQFGTNDGNMTATYDDGEPYYVSPTDFQTIMRQYIDGARGKQAVPVLVTPPPRRSCTGDSHSFGNGLAGYAAAMKTVGAATGAAVVDLNADTLAYLNMIGCVASAGFFLPGDGTHFQQNGARLMAGFIADDIRALALPLAAYRK